MTQPVEDVEKLAGKIETSVAEYDQAGFDEDRCDIIEAILRAALQPKPQEPSDELLARIDAILGKDQTG